MAKKEAQAALKQFKALGMEDDEAQDLVQRAQEKGLKMGGFLALLRKIIPLIFDELPNLFDGTGGGAPTPARGMEEDDEEPSSTTSGGAGYPVKKGAKKPS